MSDFDHMRYWRTHAAGYTDFEDFVADYASDFDDFDDCVTIVARLFEKPEPEVERCVANWVSMPTDAEGRALERRQMGLCS